MQNLPFSTHYLQDLLFVDFFDDGHPDWSEVTIVLLKCISPKISNAEHLLMCLLAVCVFSRGMSVEVICPFLDWVVCLVLTCMSCLYILEINLLSVVSFTVIIIVILHSEGCLFTSFIVFLAVQKLLIWSHLLF